MLDELDEIQSFSGNEKLSGDGEAEIEAGDFFDKLGTPPSSPQNNVLAAPEAALDSCTVEKVATEAGEQYIMKALYSGDYKSAVAACIQVFPHVLTC